MITPETDDITLIKLVARAQSEALSELYDRYNRLVFSLALTIVGDHATAEEITLDVFVRVWQRAGTYQPSQAKVSTWLLAITRHHAIDILRHQDVRPESKSIPWDHQRPQPIDNPHEVEDKVELALQKERIQAALAELPPDQQEALALAFFGGYTHQEISERLHQSLGTVKTRIRLAMQKLRRRLQEDNEPITNKSE
jgi:RNA polymerase sigma-70 factor (ECF subfamily)